jgi:membrane-associated phospholipid phosphatase
MPGVHRHRVALWWGLALTVFTVLSIFFLDAPHPVYWRGPLDASMHVIEVAFGFPISKWLTGFVLVVAGAVLWKARPWAPLVVYVGLTELVTRLIAGVLKNVFLRTRPFDARSGDAWFVDGGSSFPSGHGAHFWGLFFGVAIAFPRLRIPFLILALYVSAARILVNDHYVGDVLGSAAIAGFTAWGLAFAFRRRLTSAAIQTTS